MSSESATPSRSPILAAIGISLTIALGSVLGTADLATIEDAITGKWFTRPYTETQRGHSVAIAALEHSVAGVTREIDFVASRTDASIRRNEDEASARIARLDAEIAALKDTISGIQVTLLLASHTDKPLASSATAETAGLRSSLTELASAHHNAVAAITRRLDRIEMKAGQTTDTMARPVRKAHAVRLTKKKPAPQAEESWAAPDTARPDRGHIFNMKPVSQQRASLRLSKAPD